jgi:transposase
MAGHARIVVKLRRNVKRRLRRRMQKCRDAALRVRLNCVLLYAERKGTEEIASVLGCSRSTAINAANRFLAEGEGGLLDKRRFNGEQKVDDDMLAALVHLLEGTPQDHGWERPTWTLELLAKTLTELTRIEVSSTTVGRMLASLGARWGMPRPTVKCPWPKRKKNRRIRELEALIEALPDDEVVLYQDEVDVHLNPKIGRDWMLPGQQKDVVTPGNNVKRCLAGGLNPKTGNIVWVVGLRRNSDLFIAFLRRARAAYPRAKTIHLIVDNCKAHSSLKVRKALETEFGGSIVLHFLPPYSPKHNPIERLWGELHANVTRNHRCKTIDGLLAHVERFLEHAIPYPGSKPSLAKANTANVA